MSDKKQKKIRKKGEGSVYQLKNKTWVGKLQDGKKPDGKPNRLTFSGKTEAEVRRKIKEYHKNKERYKPENAGSISFEEYVNNWLYNHKRRQIKPSSFDRLESTIKTHLIPNLGYLQIANIHPDDIQNIINEMQDNGYAHSTIKKVHDACNNCFNFAIARRDLSYNPVMAVEMPSANQFKKEEMRILTEDEINRFKEEAVRRYKTGRLVYRHGYTFILLLETGMRVSEILGIDKEKDIDFENNTIRVRQNVVTIKERDKDNPSEIIGYINKVQDTTKTESGDRIIPLTSVAIDAIQNIITLSEGVSNIDSNYFIANEHGEPISPTTLSKSFSKVLVGAKIEHCGIHTLRHTFASRLFKQGVDAKIVSELLGHSNVGITYDTYIHLIKEQKVKAIELIDSDNGVD